MTKDEFHRIEDQSYKTGGFRVIKMPLKKDGYFIESSDGESLIFVNESLSEPLQEYVINQLILEYDDNLILDADIIY